MSLSAISSAAPFALSILEVEGSQPNSLLNGAKQTPRPADSADFLRAILDDRHPSPHDELPDVAHTIAAPRAKTDAERHAERMERKAELRKARQMVEANREATRRAILAQAAEKKQAKNEAYRQVREESHQKAAQLEKSISEFAQTSRADVVEHYERFFDISFDDRDGPDNVFQFAASDFGDSFELSWQPSEEPSAEDSQAALPSSEPSILGDKVNFMA